LTQFSSLIHLFSEKSHLIFRLYGALMCQKPQIHAHCLDLECSVIPVCLDPSCSQANQNRLP
jgi:hypothetical protein